MRRGCEDSGSMKRPNKRTLLMVLLLLIGGAIINVAVAWGCVTWADRTTWISSPLDSEWDYWRNHPRLKLRVDPQLFVLHVDSRIIFAMGVRQNLCLAQAENKHCGDISRLGVTTSTDAGWPKQSLHGWVSYSPLLNPPVEPVDAIERTSSLRSFDDVNSWRDLPTLP